MIYCPPTGDAMNLGLSSNAPAPGAMASAPKPPSLHWIAVLVLYIATIGLFGIIWAFVQAGFARKADPESKAMIYLGIAVALYVADVVLSMQRSSVAGIVGLAGGVFFLIAMYSIRDSIDLFYIQVVGIREGLSGILVFFLGPIYLQYHLCKLAKMNVTRNWARLLGRETAVMNA